MKNKNYFFRYIQLQKLTLIFLFCFLLLSCPVQAKVVKKPSKIIWFGDSRTVGLGINSYGYKTTGFPAAINRKHVVALSGATYDWARGKGYQQLKKRLKNRKTAVVIFNFGVNDIRRGQILAKKYIKLVKKVHKKFPKVKIYYMSINPVRCNPDYKYVTTQKQANLINHHISLFNSYIKKHLPKYCKYINTRNHIKFVFYDGLHYNPGTYQNISKYVTGKKRLKP